MNIDRMIVFNDTKGFKTIVDLSAIEAIKEGMASQGMKVSFFIYTKGGKTFETRDSSIFDQLERYFPKENSKENSYVKCYDKFDEELFHGDTVELQTIGLTAIFKGEDGQLYFNVNGEKRKVSEYFSNDMIKIN